MFDFVSVAEPIERLQKSAGNGSTIDPSSPGMDALNTTSSPSSPPPPHHQHVVVIVIISVIAVVVT